MSRLIQLKNKLGELFFVRPYFPINYVMITADNVNPSTWAGGTWEVFATGKTLIGVDSSQNEFNSVLKTGGEKTHTLTIDEMPNHTHGLHIYGTDKVSDYVENTLWGNTQAYNNFLSYTGGNQPHNNLPPYITVYFWRKTAM